MRPGSFLIVPMIPIFFGMFWVFWQAILLRIKKAAHWCELFFNSCQWKNSRNVFNFSFKLLIPDHFFNMAEQLVRENSYPYEVMPIMYALCSSCNDMSKVNQLLEEGKRVYEARQRLKCIDRASPASGNRNGNVPKSREVVYLFK